MFIFNPCAGKADPRELFQESIREVCERKNLDYTFLVTQARGHATQLAAQAADSATPENPVRIFAVGGDGTLCEAASGVLNKPNCELGCIPCGSGNDYVKVYGSREEFFKLESYILSHSVAADAIRADSLNSLNICSLGFDAMICDEANRIKDRNKKLSGPKAYDKAVAKCLFGKLYNDLKVTIDDNEVFEGQYIFSLAASGQYYGGGYRGAPMAVPNDGLLDFVLIKRVSHLRVPFLVGDYKSGTYFTKRSFKKLVTHRRGRKMVIESKHPAIVNVDGECIKVDKVTFEIMPGALHFIVPQTYSTDSKI